MSELNNLVNSKLSQISRENLSLAAEKCNHADQFLVEARNSGGIDKELVKQAVDLYKESLELNSRQVQPYIGLSYISYSTGDLKTAIGLLNKAVDIEPQNEKVNEMLSLFNEELKNKNISSIVSKVAGKSLSEKLKTDKKKLEINLFEKITSIFIKSTKTKKSPVINTSSGESLNQTFNPAPAASANSGNFFENIRNLSPKQERK